MQRSNPPTFQPTVWPAEPPKPPAVSPMRLTPVAGTGALEVAETDAPKDLPPDFVFRELLALDLGRLDVVEFTAQWGLAGGRGSETFEVSHGVPSDLVEDLRQWEEQSDNPLLVHPEAVRWHLQHLQLMARHLLAYLDGGDVTAAWQAPAPLGTYRPTVQENAWLHWERLVNKGLTPFTVHVRVSGGRPAVGLPRGGLFSACCLQLIQYLAHDDATLRRCANERCGQPFSRQRGTAKYGHRSRGVLYCSTQCGKAQSERERRRRRAQEAQA